MGKGSFPRSNNTKKFWDNFDNIKFHKKKEEPNLKKTCKKIKKTYKYK